MFAQKNRGSALQRAAFRQPDLLPIYGSSELNVANPYHGSALFREYPTGFTIFPIGDLGSTSLIWAQAIAAVGGDLRGKKVALSVPIRTFMNDMADRHAYTANFSRLHASELAFSTRLSFAAKQGIARRMLEYPGTLADDPLLMFALRQLADGSPASRALYYASLPLGKLQNLVLRLQDHWETLVFVRAQVGLQAVRRRESGVDWPTLLSAAEQDTRRRAGGNPFGFDSAFWASHAPEIAGQKGRYPHAAAERNAEHSAEWTDLALLLRVIEELGGEPLLLGIPLNGAYYDHLGVSPAIRRAYYERLQGLAREHQVALVDFTGHDSDKYFTVDPNLHLSGIGWVRYGRALDEFVRGQQPGDV
jgi:D-alanine transfer protein